MTAPANIATPPQSSPKVAPEVTTPNVNVLPTASTPTPVPTPAVAVPVGGTVATFFNDIRSLIDKSCDENCLNAYFQSTYHFRLFMAPDMDMISQTGATTITGLNDGMNNIRQVTIAESGVTGFNIKDVTLSTIVAGNQMTRADSSHSFTIIISEPGGISFLDAIQEAGFGLNIQNYTKAPFYLQLTFLGYDEQGKFINNPTSKFATGGRWTWAVTCTNMDIKLNEAGAVYTLTFQVSNSIYLTDAYDITRTPQSFFATGNTLGSLFKDYIDKLNVAWNKRYNGDLIVFDGIDISAVGKYFLHPAAAAGQDPRTFNLKGPNVNLVPNRSWDFKNNTYSVNVTPGYTVSEFIMDAIKHTEEGQNLAKSNNNRTADNTSDAAVNANNIRESITWVVEPVMTVKDFDTNSGNYIKHIKFVVSPYYTQNVILDRVQSNLGKGADQQRTMIEHYIQNGLFRKKYEYIFTGLNTEVLDFDLHWQMQYNHKIAAYSGALMRHDAIKPNQKLAPEDKVPDANKSTVKDGVNTVHLQKGAAVTAATPTPVPAAAPIQTSQFSRVAPGNFATPEAQLAATRIYIEDILSLQTADNPTDYAVPVSFWEGNKDVENNAGSGIFPGQKDRVQTIAGTVFSQIYSDSLPTNAFQSIKLSIRGDPYWLGQSNLHRQILLMNGGTSVANNTLPDHTTPQVIYIHFRYPVQTRDDFKPELNDSTTFNGLYSVTSVTHHFSDGVFKQELNCVKSSLVDPSKWPTGNATSSTSASAQTNTGGADSSKQQTGTSGAVPASSGTAAGASPVAGVDYTPGDKKSFIAAFAPLAQQQSALTGVAPEIILAQAGLETGWGKSAPQNNFFGIKGSGASLATTEVVGGVSQTVNQNFASNASPAASFQAYGNLINTNSHYTAVRNAVGIDAQASALGRSGYATDPNYGTSISAIANSITLPTTVASKP